MTETPTGTDSSGRLPKSREEAASAVDRVMIVAEAKFLVRQLDEYLQLISDWVVEGDDADAE